MFLPFSLCGSDPGTRPASREKGKNIEFKLIESVQKYKIENATLKNNIKYMDKNK